MQSAGNGIFGTTGYQYTRAGEVSLVTNEFNDGTHPPNLASNFTQGPNGPMSFQYGNGLYGVRNYDPVGRLAQGWTCSGTASQYCNGGSPLHQWGITPQGSQTVRACDDSLGPCATIGYDDLNRMNARVPDSGTALSNTWSYDRYGNRLTQASGQGFNVSTTFSSLTNQDSSYTYDAAGNVTYDPGTGNTYKFDPDGNVIEVDQGSSVIATYYYNALNQRVRAVNHGTPFEFVFDQWNRRTGVLNGSTGAGYEANLYWPNGGPPLAFDSNGATHFEHQDWMGTERLRTSYNGSIEGKFSSQPFGDAQTTTQGSDQDQYHYAELDHDSESGLDHAQFRHYNSSHGHWMSPDPYNGSYHWRNPQSFNRYAYVMNRPLSATDRNGMELDELGDCYSEEDCGGGGSGGGGDDSDEADSGNDQDGPCTPASPCSPDETNTIHVNASSTVQPDPGQATGTDSGTDASTSGISMENGIYTIYVNVAGSLGAPSNGIAANPTACKVVGGRTVCPSPLDNAANKNHPGATHYRDADPMCSLHVLDYPNGTEEQHIDEYNPTYSFIGLLFHYIYDDRPDMYYRKHGVYPSSGAGRDHCK